MRLKPRQLACSPVLMGNGILRGGNFTWGNGASGLQTAVLRYKEDFTALNVGAARCVYNP